MQDEANLERHEGRHEGPNLKGTKGDRSGSSLGARCAIMPKAHEAKIKMRVCASEASVR